MASLIPIPPFINKFGIWNTILPQSIYISYQVIKKSYSLRSRNAAQDGRDLIIDFAGSIEDKTYLDVVDSHSKWPETIPLRPATTTSNMAVLDKVVATHGISEMFVSDNETSSKFTESC